MGELLVLSTGGGVNGCISDSSFVNNTASSGGVVYWYGVNGCISDSSFVNNTASSGGVVYWYGADCCISDSMFIGNKEEVLH